MKKENPFDTDAAAEPSERLSYQEYLAMKEEILMSNRLRAMTPHNTLEKLLWWHKLVNFFLKIIGKKPRYSLIIYSKLSWREKLAFHGRVAAGVVGLACMPAGVLLAAAMLDRKKTEPQRNPFAGSEPEVKPKRKPRKKPKRKATKKLKRKPKKKVKKPKRKSKKK